MNTIPAHITEHVGTVIADRIETVADRLSRPPFANQIRMNELVGLEADLAAAVLHGLMTLSNAERVDFCNAILPKGYTIKVPKK